MQFSAASRHHLEDVVGAACDEFCLDLFGMRLPVRPRVERYKKGRPSSGPVREDSLEQLFNVDALNTEGGVQ